MRQWIGVVCALACMLAGCQTASENAAPPPANLRQIVADYVRTTYNDPYSIRDASVSAPIPGHNAYGAMHTVCVRANAKNRFGAYIGQKSNALIVQGGKVITSTEQYANLTCGSAVYQPFPEIEERRR